jgi:acetyl esterase/lipase
MNQKTPSVQFYIFRPLMRLARWYQNRLVKKNINSLLTFRRLSDWLAERIMFFPSGVELIESKLGNIPGTWFIPDGAEEDPVLLFLHGGSNVFTWGKPHRRIVSYLSKYSGLKAFGVDFRLAPDHPYPAAHEDCFQVYKELVNSGKRVILIGESSGGVLALATILSAKSAGLDLPVLCILLSPLCEYSNPDLETYPDPFVHPDFVRNLSRIYLAGESPDKADLNPLCSDLFDFPPLFVMVGEKEILRGETEKLINKAQQDGIDVEVCLWPHVWHGWHVLVPQLPEATQALKALGESIIRVCNI